MLLKYLLFEVWGYSDGPTRRRGSEEGLVPTGVAQATDCGNGGETKGQRGAGGRQRRERINFLNLHGSGDLKHIGIVSQCFCGFSHLKSDRSANKLANCVWPKGLPHND